MGSGGTYCSQDQGKKKNVFEGGQTAPRQREAEREEQKRKKKRGTLPWESAGAHLRESKTRYKMKGPGEEKSRSSERFVKLYIDRGKISKSCLRWCQTGKGNRKVQQGEKAAWEKRKKSRKGDTDQKKRGRCLKKRKGSKGDQKEGM